MAITILAAIHLYKRGFISINKINALYNKIKTLFDKIKKSIRDCFTKINANPEVYIPETMQKL